jgi:hypothetical protein
MNLQKLWFWLSNIAFALVWLSLLVRTLRHWNAVPVASHFWLVDLNAIFLLLWAYLLREKNSPTCIAIASFALLAAMRTALLASL